MADCAQGLDRRNQGMGQEFVDISKKKIERNGGVYYKFPKFKALDKDQNKRNELQEMKGPDAAHKIQHRESCQKHPDVQPMTGMCHKDEECH